MHQRQGSGASAISVLLYGLGKSVCAEDVSDWLVMNERQGISAKAEGADIQPHSRCWEVGGERQSRVLVLDLTGITGEWQKTGSNPHVHQDLGSLEQSGPSPHGSLWRSEKEWRRLLLIWLDVQDILFGEKHTVQTNVFYSWCKYIDLLVFSKRLKGHTKVIIMLSKGKGVERFPQIYLVYSFIFEPCKCLT